MSQVKGHKGQQRTKPERLAMARHMVQHIVRRDDENAVTYRGLATLFNVDPATVRNYLKEWLADSDGRSDLTEQEQADSDYILSWMHSKTTSPAERDRCAALAIEMLEDMHGDDRYGVRSIVEIATLLSVDYGSLRHWIASYEARHPQTSYSSGKTARIRTDNGLKNAVALGDVERVREIREVESQRMQRALALIDERLGREIA